VQCPIFEVAQAIKNARVTAQSIRELTKHAAETHVMTRRQLTPNEPDVPDEIHVVCIKNESYLHDEMHPGERYKIDGELNAKPIANENGGIIFERALA
jgi:hypothetical protein